MESHEKFLASLREIKGKQPFSFCGLDLIGYPDVFSPIQSTDTEWFSQNLLEICKDKRVLEIGAGTGAISLSLLKNGARSVTATDINPHAIENIKENQERAKLYFPVFEGSLFSPLPDGSKFDVIFWNHPFQKSEVVPSDTIEASMVDYKYQFLRKYIQEGFSFLSEQGKIYLCTGDLESYFADILKLAQEEGVKLHLVQEGAIPTFKDADTRIKIGIFEIVRERV